MEQEIQEKIHTTLDGDATLTGLLGGAGNIVYGWPSGEQRIDDDNCLLFWGSDIIDGAQPDHGTAATKRRPDSTVAFHIFGYDVKLVNDCVDAVFNLFHETTMTTTNFNVLRLMSSGTTSLYEGTGQKDIWHKITSFTFREIWKTT